MSTKQPAPWAGAAACERSKAGHAEGRSTKAPRQRCAQPAPDHGEVINALLLPCFAAPSLRSAGPALVGRGR